jgi:hypothetical protein
MHGWWRRKALRMAAVAASVVLYVQARSFISGGGHLVTIHRKASCWKQMNWFYRACMRLAVSVTDAGFTLFHALCIQSPHKIAHSAG